MPSAPSTSATATTRRCPRWPPRRWPARRTAGADGPGAAVQHRRHEVERRRRRSSRRRPARRRTGAGRTCRSCRSPARNTSGSRHTQVNGVERPDRRPGGEQLDVVGGAVRADRRHHLVAEELEELALDPRLPPGVALAGQQRPPVDAVDRVQLDPPGVDQLASTRRRGGSARSPRRRRRRSGTRAPACRTCPSGRRRRRARRAVGVPASTRACDITACSRSRRGSSRAPALDAVPEQRR